MVIVSTRLLRQRMWGFYFLRSPLFHVFTKPVANAVRTCLLARLLAGFIVVLIRSPALTITMMWNFMQTAFMFSWVPLLSMIIAYMRDMLFFFQRHHFYTSASS